MESLLPKKIIEWIPYNNLQNINYLTKGGYSEIYTAIWIDGRYEEWDSKEQQLKRFGRQSVVLKKLENVENANNNWFEEAKSHLTISNKQGIIIQCYGLTQEPSNEEQEAFHSKSYDNFNIPDNIDDFNKSINRENDTLKGSEDLSKAINDLQINTKDDTQSNYKMETMQLRVKKYDDIDDEKEIHNDPNLHSEEQDELEIPDEI
ncbi:unnamed protein product [Rhizophagus irregularis]|nr:unnamed protein product [Rhizophagus irregularis]